METECFVRSFDGTQIFVNVLGNPDGIPLLLCDGLGCDGFVWPYIKETFADRYRLVHFHNRGHGLSEAPKAEDALRVEDLCGDLLAVMDACDVERAVLLGHSMGVQVILNLAVTHPQRVIALVPMCGSYARPLDTFHDNLVLKRLYPHLRELVERFPSAAQKLWTGLCRNELGYQVAKRVELNGQLLRRADFDPYLAHLSSMDVEVFVRLLGNLDEHSVEHLLHTISAPTLVVAGEKDNFTPAWLSVRMQQLIPGAELLMIPSGTHAAPIELPELVNLRLERFFNQRVLPTLKTQDEAVSAPAKPSKRRKKVPTSPDTGNPFVGEVRVPRKKASKAKPSNSAKKKTTKSSRKTKATSKKASKKKTARAKTGARRGANKKGPSGRAVAKASAAGKGRRPSQGRVTWVEQKR